MSLVGALTRQLGGRLAVGDEPARAVTIAFPRRVTQRATT